jgi:hypothetical protein
MRRRAISGDFPLRVGKARLNVCGIMRYSSLFLSIVFSSTILLGFSGCERNGPEFQAYEGKLSEAHPNAVLEIYHRDAANGELVLANACVDVTKDGKADLLVEFQAGSIVRVSDINDAQNSFLSDLGLSPESFRPNDVAPSAALVAVAAAASAKPDADDLNALYSKTPDANAAWALAVKLRNCKDQELTKKITFRAAAILRQGGPLFDLSAFILAGQGVWGQSTLGNVLATVDDRDTVEKMSKALLTLSSATSIAPALDSMLAFLEKENPDYEYAQRNVFYAFANEGQRNADTLRTLRSKLTAIQQKRAGNEWFSQQVERLKLRWVQNEIFTRPKDAAGTPTPAPEPIKPAASATPTAPVDYKAKFEAMLPALPPPAPEPPPLPVDAEPPSAPATAPTPPSAPVTTPAPAPTPAAPTPTPAPPTPAPTTPAPAEAPAPTPSAATPVAPAAPDAPAK